MTETIFMILLIAFIAVSVWVIAKYNKKVIEPVRKEMMVPEPEMWKAFICDTIERWTNADQCFYSGRLIEMFAEVFKEELPEPIIEKYVNEMTNKQIMKFNELCEITIDDFINAQ